MGSNPGNQNENSNNKHRLPVSYNDIGSLRLMRISEFPYIGIPGSSVFFI
ncbi:hypothetical protein HDG37_006813 [Paraburkholderia sp. MM5384-R2]|nr:hypothetical protein [Paraburkholderia sp. MM5384-R2]